jgi:chemotaxis response regulator CheB
MTNSPSADGSIKPGRDGAAMRDIAASPPDQVASQRQALRPSAEIDALKQPVVSPVVGIGASAGGLKSLQELLSCLPVDTGMAFVVVSHMDSTHESLLPSLLANSTGMPVQDVRNETVVEPNRVYVIMPGTEIRLDQGALHASPRSNVMPHMPIDDFFATLARELRNRAIGVTGFFRDPGVFEALRTVVFPEIIAHPSSDRTIRV